MNSSSSSNGNSPTLVVGATGQLGGGIARLLCEAKRPVRAVVREGADPAKKAALRALPIEAVAADLKDAASLARACQGATTVISTATAIVSHREGDTLSSVDELGQLALVDAAKAAGVEHFVFISFLPNELDYAFQTAKRKVEVAVQESGMSFTILRPTAFMELWLSPMVGFDPCAGRARILGDGTKPVSWISALDVARFAVAASEGGKFSKQIVALGGPDALSPLEVVRIFEELGAPKVELEFVPEVALQGMLAGASNPFEQALSASMLATARGQVVAPQESQDLLPGRLVAVRDFATRLMSR
jgi:uncharacterized protein YbjT (DUF2867 family)